LSCRNIDGTSRNRYGQQLAFEFVDRGNSLCAPYLEYVPLCVCAKIFHTRPAEPGRYQERSVCRMSISSDRSAFLPLTTPVNWGFAFRPLFRKKPAFAATVKSVKAAARGSTA